MDVYEQVKKALQDIVAPEIQGLNVQIQRLDEKMDSLRREVSVEFKRVDDGIASLRRDLEQAITIRERLAGLEAQVAATATRPLPKAVARKKER